MHLLEQHPRYPPGTTSSEVDVPGLDPDSIATSAHIVADHLVFAALDGDTFRVGLVDPQGRARLFAEPAAHPALSTSSRRVAYVATGGYVILIDMASKSATPISSPATHVTLSPTGEWATTRTPEGHEIWQASTAELTGTTTGATVATAHILTITDTGHPHLTLHETMSAVREVAADHGPFTLRGVAALADGSSTAFFDSLYGTLTLTKGPGDDSSLTTQCLSGWWVVGETRENESRVLVTQRLDQVERHPLPLARRPPPADDRDPSNSSSMPFTIDWVTSSEDVRIPVSRFRSSAVASRPRSLVTVHGGFGLSLRPFSGAPGRVDVSDIVYAHVRGGGELGQEWAMAGRGESKPAALNDLCAVLRMERSRGEVNLLGTSHGGWLSLLAALEEPQLIDRACVTSPILDLRAYLETPLGIKHRGEFPEHGVDAMDPIVKLAHRDPAPLPRLLIICGQNDRTVSGQDPEQFATMWRRHGGQCEVKWHNSGHYAPGASQVDDVTATQVRFFASPTSG